MKTFTAIKFFTFVILIFTIAELVHRVHADEITEEQLNAQLDGVLTKAKSTNFNPNEWSADVETYEAPEILKKALPYYVLGYDYENRPVFVWEVGHWALKKTLEISPEMAQEVVRYSEQMWYRMGKARPPNGTTGDDDDDDAGAGLVIDGGDFSPSELLSIDTVSNHLLQARWGERIQTNLAYLFCINVNFITRTWLNIVKPVAGKFFGRLEIHGPNRAIWEPLLRTKIDREQLPPWYGGKEGYTPAQIF